jgi:RNA polymerase-binding transcription factor DksA
LHESDFQRLRFIQEALKALDRGQYGDCIRCQEETEKDRSSSDLVMAGLEEETDF